MATGEGIAGSSAAASAKVDETEMEPSVTLNTIRSFLPEYDRLKKFTIPKRTPDKDFLTDCSTNQRDCQEVKERLNQGCFDRECDLGSLWHFDKIEMVHNKDLEEEFVAKRTKMREQGRGDKELSSFLVVSKDEVLKICQSGLRTSNSIKKEPDIMRELGNPQLGVYLFRHVDIALNYASKHSVQVENIIIFRVLLGKVKKIQPPKGKKKVVLDPTPNYDCHVSRVNPSLKDSVEDQAIGSLVYFYEYSELSKPVSRPRQCLPHAVVKVKCINQKVRANYPVVSLKTRPKKFSKGRGRDLLLENCTIVTRIGNSKLIYEHFHKPQNSAASDNLSAEVSSLSESAPNWNGSGAETQSSKIKCILPGQWNSAQVTLLMTTKKKQEKEARRNVRKDGRSKPLQKELQLKISTGSTWNKKDERLNDRPSLSPLYSKCLKAADAEDRIESSPSVSSPTSDNSNTLYGQKNPTDLNDLPKNWRGCSKENNQQCFASCDERGKGTSVSPNKDPSPQNSPEDSFTSAATLSGDSCVLSTQDQHHSPKQDITENASCLIPNCYTGGPLELDNSREMCGKKSVANCVPACSSDSSAIPELNKFTEIESLCSSPFSAENIQASAQCSAFSQNERTEETPHVHSYSVHTYKTVCPSYSWHFYQTGSNCHQVTQTYQEFSSYEMQQLTPTMLTATSMVYNAQSSMFYSQSYSYMGVGESQTYPVHSYFNSTMAFPYTYQQWPSWYTERHPTAQVAYPYSSNTGL